MDGIYLKNSMVIAVSGMEKIFILNGNIFVTPDWFKAYMPAGVALDGELFLGRECFQQCGLFRRKNSR